MSHPQPTSMESTLQESRKFPPPKGFRESAHISGPDHYQTMYQRSIEDPETFWAEQASALHWFKKWDRVLEWDCPDAKWFVGGKTNLCYNCVDRQVEAGLGDQIAIIWEAEAMGEGDGGVGALPQTRHITYADLLRDVQRFANVLKKLGVSTGDVVTIYMPMVPELAVAMLACARIGAVHSIIFGGFSASAIRDRVEDGKSRLILTADGGFRRGQVVPLKDNVDEACKQTNLVENVVVLRHARNDINTVDSRDLDWHTLTADAEADCPCEELDSEDLAFILYTSGSTGKPKGIMHTVGGYMVYTYLTSRLVFDLGGEGIQGRRDAGTKGEEGKDPNHASDFPKSLRPSVPSSIRPSSPRPYWCTADIGWITGHSYIIYGILPNAVPTLMYEGAPNHPGPDRFWDIIERHKVSKFYTAPTAIRAFMKWGREHVEKHDLTSLKVLGTVGEPINPEAWMWYHDVIGGGQCPIVDTWWQTETGGHMLTPLPGATTTVPGSCTKPFFGIDAAVVDDDGNEVDADTGGILVIRKPWPGMLRGIYGDRDRFIETYWSRFRDRGWYVPGDGARQDSEGHFWIMGRIDDVIVTAGHNLGTMEIESALVNHDAVAEAAVVGFPHEIKGNGIACFVTLRGGVDASDSLNAELCEHVAQQIGKIARPDQLRFTDALPKTRSGKIMRRLLRDIAAGRETRGDTTTLEDSSIVDQLRNSSQG